MPHRILRKSEDNTVNQWFLSARQRAVETKTSMTPDWLKRLKNEPKGPDLNKPVSVGNPMKDLRAPLPNPEAKKPTRNWEWYNQTPRGRRWVRKMRYT